MRTPENPSCLGEKKYVSVCSGVAQLERVISLIERQGRGKSEGGIKKKGYLIRR